MKSVSVALLFGSVSSEHEVSVVSAQFVCDSLRKASPAGRYEVVPVFISKEGKWFLYPSDRPLSEADSIPESSMTPAFLSPDRSHHGLLVLGDTPSVLRIDVIFPVLHGKNGEDGTVQGLADLAGIPIVGCGVLASAVCMDKVVTKLLLEAAGIATSPFRWFMRSELSRLSDILDDCEENFTYPIFVKPANAGSSVGVSKAADRASLEKGVELALLEDDKILIEQGISGQEIEIAVFGGGEDIFVSGAGEITVPGGFYSYDAKYNDDTSELFIPARIPAEIETEARAIARKAFHTLGCEGLSRIDFFISGGKVILNEINTLPGFTPISMYPKLMEKAGRPAPGLVAALTERALSR